MTYKEMLERSKIEKPDVYDWMEYKNVNNPKRFSAPKAAGLYLIGNTIFNPNTNEKLYLVKVGYSSCVSNRINSYRGYNPFIFHIDFYSFHEPLKEKRLSEFFCHKVLAILGNHIERCDEWFLIPEDIYLSICQKGFSFFQEICDSK